MLRVLLTIGTRTDDQVPGVPKMKIGPLADCQSINISLRIQKLVKEP